MYWLAGLYGLYWQAGSDRIAVVFLHCIAGYCYRWISLDFPVSLDIAGTGTGSYRIIMAGCKDGTDGTDRTDGNDGNDGQMGRWREWGGRLLAPAGTGATEQERHHWLAG